MSADALKEILVILKKHENISAKVMLETTRTGIIWTTISLRETAGIQPNSSSRNSSKKPKKKSPSRLLRDKIRNEAYLSRKAGSRDEDTPGAPGVSSSRDPAFLER